MSTRARNRARVSLGPAIERRAVRSIDKPLPNCLLSEVLAQIPSALMVTVWNQTASRSYSFRASTLPESRHRQLAAQIDEMVRSPLGLHVIGPSATRALYKGAVDDRPRKIRLRQQFNDGPLAGIDNLWAVYLSLERRPPYLIEIFTKRAPAGLAVLRSSLETFVKAYLTARGIEEASSDLHSRTASRVTADLFHSVSLADAQERVSRVIRARTHSSSVKETYLFLLDPYDLCLYYASTDHLRLRPKRSGKLHLPPAQLRKDQLEYIRAQVARGDGELGKNGFLISTLQTLLTSELDLRSIDTVTSDALKSILRFLPQEADSGVGGDAVMSRVLTIGGERGAGLHETRWDPDTLEHRMFLFKLLVEQVFGVGFNGTLVAAPTFDGPQVAGVVFAVTPKVSCVLAEAVLEAADEAAEVLTNHRRESFLEAVIQQLQKDPDRDARLVIGDNLARILTYRLLVLVNADGNAESIAAAWWRAPRTLRLGRMSTEDEIALTDSSWLSRFLSSIKRSTVTIHAIKPPLRSDAFFRHFGNGELVTVAVLPADGGSYFVAFLSEYSKTVELAIESLRQKGVLVRSLAALPEAVRRSAAYLGQQHERLVSGHHFEKRFIFPLAELAQEVEDYASDAEVPDHLRTKLHDVSINLDLRARMLEQFNWEVCEQKTPNSQFPPVDLTCVLRDILPVFVKPFLSRLETATGAPYSRIEFDVTAVLPNLILHVDMYELINVLHHVIENAVSDHAISPDLLGKSANKGRIALSAKPTQTPSGIEISITDSGHGMTSEIVEYQNERLRRIKKDGRTAVTIGTNGTRTEVLHTGLVDIALFARKFCADNGERGAVYIISKKDVGTCVRIVLPCTTDRTTTEGVVANAARERQSSQ